jgi:hypothetical protein
MVLRAHLKGEAPADKIHPDGVVGMHVPWRPHLYEVERMRGWYIHAGLPLSDSWAQRIDKAKAARSKLQIGVAGTEELFSDEEFLQRCHELNASILIYKQRSDTYVVERTFATVDDFIYAARLKLSTQAARDILNRALDRSLQERNKNRKGVLFELVVAVLLSQVEGFEVTSVGISNRTQQMDVFVHNRNVGGALGNSPVVIAEAKNWKNPVDTNEYASFVRKLQSRHGRAKLGYLVTTGRFTAGVALERRRESLADTLVVLLDGQTLPQLWTASEGITAAIEHATMTAAVGT